jgi:hypothetical protein
MAELSGYTTPKAIVSAVMLDEGDGSDMGQYKRYLNWVIRGYKQLKMFALPNAKEVRIAVNSDIYAVTLPKDFVKFVSIGRPYKGKMDTFIQYNELIATTTEACGQQTQLDSNGENVTQYNDTYNTLYGMGGGIGQYYYKLDLNNDRILINGSPILTTVILKYISTGIEIGATTYIPVIAEESLIAYVHWQEALNSPTPDQRYTKSNLSSTAVREREYQKAFNSLKYMVNMPTIQDLYDAVHESFTQTIKR